MLKKEQYIRTVRRPYPPFWGSLMLKGISQYDHYEQLLEKRFAILETIKSKQVWYYSRVELEESGRVTFDYWSQPGVLSRIIKLLEQDEKKILKAAAAGVEIRQFIGIHGPYMPTLILVWGVEQLIEDAVRQLLNQRLSAVDTKQLLDQLNVPLRDNFYKKEEYDLVMSEDLKAHVKKYQWINARYGEDNPYTIEQALDRLAGIDKAEFLEERDQSKTKVEQAIVTAKGVMGEVSSLIDLMQFVIYYRTQRTDILNQASFLYMPTLKKMAREMNLEYEQLLYVTIDEVLGSLPTLEVVKMRQDDHALLLEEGKVSCVHGEESAKIAELLKDDVDGIEEIQGSVACQGKVVGTVRLIWQTDDIDRVEVGDVLVTSMTTPNMIPAMKRAAAFVTDEGGITSHAAIISREMKKPCIIGTKIATQVLKDGDQVEVDADEGIVKKI